MSKSSDIRVENAHGIFVISCDEMDIAIQRYLPASPSMLREQLAMATAVNPVVYAYVRSASELLVMLAACDNTREMALAENGAMIKILGIDDWLIYARDTETGELLYVNTEVWSEWLDAPHKGEAEYGSTEDTEDWRYIVRAARSIPRACWSVSEYPLGMTDAEFITR